MSDRYERNHARETENQENISYITPHHITESNITISLKTGQEAHDQFWHRSTKRNNREADHKTRDTEFFGERRGATYENIGSSDQDSKAENERENRENHIGIIKKYSRMQLSSVYIF